MSGEDEPTMINTKEQENRPSSGESDEGVFRVPQSKTEIEREQEAKLKSKFGGLRKPGGGSALLQKRLQKGQKFFDSGDYNMAKAKMNNPKMPLAAREKLMLQESIGGAIPTATEVENIRRPSQMSSNLLLTGMDGHGGPQ